MELHVMARKYERIADELRQEIKAGQLSPGDRLPTEADLTIRFKVSAPTVQQGLGVLQAEGLIDRVHGVGNFVRKPRQRVQRTPDRHHWEKDRARLSKEKRLGTGATERDTGLGTSDLDFFAKYDAQPANADLAEVFDVPVGTKLLHRVYRTKLQSEAAPLSLIDSYLPYELAAKNPELLSDENEPWPGGTQSQLFSIGIELDRIEEQLTARPPSLEESDLLELGRGTSVLVMRKTSIDTSERAVEVSDIVMPGDRTVASYVTKLKRWED
jgi:GntR family transcriptional regulator